MDSANQLGNLWQKSMIGLARSQWVRDLVQGTGPVRQLAARFVGGETRKEVVKTALALKSRGLATSLFFLGEYVTDPARVAHTMAELGQALKLAGNAGLSLHTSIDPTQAGLMQSRERCEQNLGGLAETVRALARNRASDILMVDMEDSSVTQATLEIFSALQTRGLPVGVTLQACLKRTPGDLPRVSGAMVRLVKGAFAESPDIAFRPGKETDLAYLGLAGKLLDQDSLDRGTVPVFATHDHGLIRQITGLAARQGIDRDAFEFEMLYGVRPGLQERLAEAGFRVRVYLPFGRDFWPYCVRRIGENPKNMRFLARALGRG